MTIIFKINKINEITLIHYPLCIPTHIMSEIEVGMCVCVPVCVPISVGCNAQHFTGRVVLGGQPAA